MRDFLSSLGRDWADAEPNPLTALKRRLEAQGHDVIDLVGANLHEHGLVFPADRLAEIAALALPQTAVYRPHPLGQAAAREAVSAWYFRRGVAISPECVMLTPGTSLAYWYLFRVLLEAGDEVLVPHPGYPLFGDICALAGVRGRFYHLRAVDGGWRPDFEDLAFQVTRRTRAVVVVSPHNPLGTVFREDEWDALREICEQGSLALIHDEVFSEFLVDDRVLPRPREFPLSFSLNGASKMLSLPGLKLGWIAASGAHAQRAMRALEHVSDTFLPVGELAQAMAPALLAEASVPSMLAEAYRARRRVASKALRFPVVEAEGGVYLCAQVSQDEDAFCEEALQTRGVLVHPGHFYDLAGHFVFTCVAAPPTLTKGCARL